MAEIVERTWTPIGTEGFEYYWDPDKPSDDKGRKIVLFRHSADHDVNCIGHVDITGQDIGYGIERLRMDVEWSWRRRMN